MQHYALDYFGFSNEDGDGCMAVFVAFPDVKGAGDTFEEAEADAYEQLEIYLKKKENAMQPTFEAAVAAYDAQRFEEAYVKFESAAQQEHPQAMVNLAVMRMQGVGCTRDARLAREWFEKASKLGNTHATVGLGQCYEAGIGTEPDKVLALACYSRAADAGNGDAELKAGLLYREKGEIYDAMRYLIAAAHNSNAQAQALITFVSNAELATVQNSTFRTMDIAEQRARVEALIETTIRPILAADNGGIELVAYEAGDTPQIWLNYLGACSGCHLGSTSTADMLLQHFETLIDKNIVLYLM